MPWPADSTSSECSYLSPTPTPSKASGGPEGSLARSFMVGTLKRGGLGFSWAEAATDVRPPPPCWATDPGSAPLDRLQRAGASRRRDRGAGALGNQPPGITLVVDLCGRGARRSGTGGAVVHALERDA